jgi:hypothetical protein
MKRPALDASKGGPSPGSNFEYEVLTLEHPDQPGVRLTWTAESPKDLRKLEAVARSGQLLART